jgi:tryptophan-rich sensory protein
MPEPHVISAILWAVLLGGAGGLLTTIGPWYRNLRKPPWQPPDWLFGPAWTLILGMAAWAAVLAWEGASVMPGAAADQGHREIILLFAANFVFHLLWSPLFFTFRRPDWALFEVVFLWASVLALCIGLAPYSTLASWLIVPYLAWVSFAAILNLVIVRLNGPFGQPAAD